MEKVGVKAKVVELNNRYPWLWPTLFFVLGVIFDIATIGRIDDLFSILQQGIYLLVLSILVTVDLVFEANGKMPPPWLARVWTYREEAIHFLFGSLLSVYTIFYFMSASITASAAFLVLIAVFLVANEIPRFRPFGGVMRFGLLALCLASYFGYLVPIAWGNIGLFPFVTALLATLLVFALIARLVQGQVPDPLAAWKKIMFPGGGVVGAFLLLYLFALVPPVPLSIQFAGIYHRIERVGDKYRLSHERPWWKFWQTGDETFLYRPGDKLHAFARIFSPARFEGKVFVRWSLKRERRGWETWDAIPIKIVGGRDEGFRGVAIKENFTVGEWRLQFETEDEREIGRIHFKVVADESTEERSFRIDEA